MAVDVNILLSKHVTIKGAFIFDDSDFTDALRLVAEGKVKGEMVTRRIGLEDIVKEGFDEVMNHKDRHIKILVSPKGVSS
jgi:threonine dehydrogenase-like Zn-dependent dehydrogenase